MMDAVQASKVQSQSVAVRHPSGGGAYDRPPPARMPQIASQSQRSTMQTVLASSRSEEVRRSSAEDERTQAWRDHTMRLALNPTTHDLESRFHAERPHRWQGSDPALRSRAMQSISRSVASLRIDVPQAVSAPSFGIQAATERTPMYRGPGSAVERHELFSAAALDHQQHYLSHLTPLATTRTLLTPTVLPSQRERRAEDFAPRTRQPDALPNRCRSQTMAAAPTVRETTRADQVRQLRGHLTLEWQENQRRYQQQCQPAVPVVESQQLQRHERGAPYVRRGDARPSPPSRSRPLDHDTDARDAGREVEVLGRTRSASNPGARFETRTALGPVTPYPWAARERETRRQHSNSIGTLSSASVWSTTTTGSSSSSWKDLPPLIGPRKRSADHLGLRPATTRASPAELAAKLPPIVEPTREPGAESSTPLTPIPALHRDHRWHHPPARRQQQHHADDHARDLSGISDTVTSRTGSSSCSSSTSPPSSSSPPARSQHQQLKPADTPPQSATLSPMDVRSIT